MSVRTLLRCWDDFWFTPQSPAAVCLFRVLYGLLICAWCLLIGPDLLTWFGPSGSVSLPTIQSYEVGPRFSLFFLLPDTNSTAVLLLCTLAVAAIFVTLGLFTRLSLCVTFIVFVSFYFRNPIICNSGDDLLRIMGFLLIFSPAGEMFSLDRLLNRRRGLAPADPWSIRCSPWAQHLMQLEVAAVYCTTFWRKFPGDDWWDGTAVYYATHLPEFARLPVPFLYDHLWTLNLLTWGTMAIEFSFWTLIWIKELRYVVLCCGVALHLGIDWSMNIPLFELLMIASYTNFVEAADLKRALAFVSRLCRGRGSRVGSSTELSA